MSRRGNLDGSFRKRPDGRWEARIVLNNKRRSFYGKTREEVARKLRAAHNQTDQGMPIPSERLTVGRFLDQWLETSARPSVRPSTYRVYAGHVEHHLKPALGRVSLTKLQPQQVQKLLNDTLATGLSPTTVLRIRATLRRALNQAMKWGLVSRNVATLINPPKQEKYHVEPITPEEANAILAAVAEHRLACLFTVLLGVGLRLGEALGLSWDDLDLDRGMVTVRNSLQRLNGEFKLVPPKSDSSRRTLPLPAFVVVDLNQHREAQDREREAVGDAWINDRLVFTSDHGKPLHSSSINRSFTRLLAAAGMRKWRPHDLRHGCASLLLAKGVSPRVVMETLGHSQISLTMNTYAHVIPALQREAAERMDEIFKPAPR